MKLYHFTSERHLRAIGLHGLTVGDVPTDLALNQGRCGVWLTSNHTPSGHGLEGSIADKTRFRLTVDAPNDGQLVRWVDWAPKHVTPWTFRTINDNTPSFDSWYIYFGVIDRSAIIECVDMQTGSVTEDWASKPPSPLDVKPVPAHRRAVWHKKLLRKVARALQAA